MMMNIGREIQNSNYDVRYIRRDAAKDLSTTGGMDNKCEFRDVRVCGKS
jgi:hypothetical protein